MFMETVTKQLPAKLGGPALALVLAVLSYAAGWGRNVEQVAILQQQVTVLQQTTVRIDSLNDVKERLTRIENKLDRLTDGGGFNGRN